MICISGAISLVNLTLSGKQKTVLQHAIGERTTLLAAGSIRSGKTYSTIMGWVVWHLSSGMEEDSAIIGQSIEVIMRNVGFDLIDRYKSLGAKARLDKSIGTRIVVEDGGKEASIWLVGAADARAKKRIQGATLKGLMVDEIVLIEQDFFMQAWGRLSVTGAKMWATYNREGPTHWFKRTVEDKLKEFDATLVDFDMSDNPSLAESVKQRYEDSYFGHFYTRLIEGKWAGASGLIFPNWQNGDAITNAKRMCLSMDWGQYGTLAVLAIQIGDAKSHVVGEMIHNAAIEGDWTTLEVFKAIKAFASTWSDPQRMVLWMDPATPVTVKRAARQSGFIARDAKNAVVPGIISTRQRLETGQLTLGNVPHLKDELATYEWDSAKAEIGEDAPVKDQDHAIDALRYFAHSTDQVYWNSKPVKVKHTGM